MLWQRRGLFRACSWLQAGANGKFGANSKFGAAFAACFCMLSATLSCHMTWQKHAANAAPILLLAPNLPLASACNREQEHESCQALHHEASMMMPQHLLSETYLGHAPKTAQVFAQVFIQDSGPVVFLVHQCATSPRWWSCAFSALVVNLLD